MKLRQIRVQGLRCLTDVSIEPSPGINAFIGENGAGKTSLLEAVFLLSHGRSFRSGARDALLQRNAPGLAIYAELSCAGDQVRRLGLGREGQRWQARVDGQAATLAQLVRTCAVVSFDPGSHALIAAGAEERRRYLDWGVFHVEHDFLPTWQRYQRALKQRNSLLRAGERDESLYLVWERELAQGAEQVTRWRRAYLDRLMPELSAHAVELLPELGPIALRYRQGWPEEIELIEALAMQRGRDLSRGHTSVGPHRADWSLAYEQAPQREHLSRGQEKLTAVACLLAQAALFAGHAGEWPVICIDDLASELDDRHQSALLARLQGADAQVLVSGTSKIPGLEAAAVFHVEQGRVTPLL